MENKDYLQKQIITYIGNKRQLLFLIKDGIDLVKNELQQDKISFLDLFSGSGIVARFAKQYASELIVNDLEYYSYVINDCYVSNKDDIDMNLLQEYYQLLKTTENLTNYGFISELYAPKDDNDIQKGERVFYTKANALYLDNMLYNIHAHIPKELQKFFVAPLLSEASIHVNTAGVFKGFYKGDDGIGSFGAKGKNALSRIMGNISLPFPLFSNYHTKNKIYQCDANQLIDNLDMVDICYLDPPYNQHPYGSNYFMLNAIAKNSAPTAISTVSGIPNDWQRSNYNNKKKIYSELEDLIERVKAKYILLSFNNEGYLSKEELIEILSKNGELQIIETKYNTYRGSRNLNNRSIHVSEYLFVLKKIIDK